MAKLQLIHGDTFYRNSYIKNPIILASRWHHWKEKHEEALKKLSYTNNQSIADVAQAWHLLCAMTAMLKEQGSFDIKNRCPKEEK